MQTSKFYKYCHDLLLFALYFLQNVLAKDLWVLDNKASYGCLKERFCLPDSKLDHYHDLSLI